MRQLSRSASSTLCDHQTDHPGGDHQVGDEVESLILHRVDHGKGQGPDADDGPHEKSNIPIARQTVEVAPHTPAAPPVGRIIWHVVNSAMPSGAGIQ